jgi:hypothetical protein
MPIGVVNQAFTKHGSISDFNSKEEALQIIPPFLRHQARIIALVTFSKTDIQDFSASMQQQGKD